MKTSDEVRVSFHLVVLPDPNHKASGITLKTWAFGCAEVSLQINWSVLKNESPPSICLSSIIYKCHSAILLAGLKFGVSPKRLD